MSKVVNHIYKTNVRKMLDQTWKKRERKIVRSLKRFCLSLCLFWKNIWWNSVSFSVVTLQFNGYFHPFMGLFLKWYKSNAPAVNMVTATSDNPSVTVQLTHFQSFLSPNGQTHHQYHKMSISHKLELEDFVTFYFSCTKSSSLLRR